MARRYERDDVERRVTATAEGYFRTDEILEFLERMWEDGTWDYAVLLDLRFVVGAPSLADLRRIADAARGRGEGEERRAPTAIVAMNPSLYGMALAYASMMQPGRVEGFHDRNQAELWLAKCTPDLH